MPLRLGTMGDVCSIVQTSNLLSFYIRGQVQRQVGGRGDRLETVVIQGGTYYISGEDFCQNYGFNDKSVNLPKM